MATLFSSYVRCDKTECASYCPSPYNNADYGIVLFNEDLTNTIAPISVMAAPSDFGNPGRIWIYTGIPRNVLHVYGIPPSLPPFDNNTVSIYGDSGSPYLIPTSSGLVFFGGPTTSGPSVSPMQEDMTYLINQYNSENGLLPGQQGYLDPNNPDYQLHWR